MAHFRGAPRSRVSVIVMWPLEDRLAILAQASWSSGFTAAHHCPSQETFAAALPSLAIPGCRTSAMICRPLRQHRWRVLGSRKESDPSASLLDTAGGWEETGYFLYIKR